jgi:predicted membrane protein
MTYPFGYLYPNEFAEPLVWLPTLFTYSLLISGAGLLTMAFVAYLFGGLKRAIPLLLTLGLALFTVVLLGPLADLKAPDRAILLFSHAHITPTEAHPGVSLIALEGSVIWPLAWVLAVLFTLLYFSYPMHVKYMATRNPLYKVLSLGVSTPERYNALKPLLKVLAALALTPLAFWAVYPATLFVIQTSLFIWRKWTLLPAIAFADTFVTATAAAILAAWIIGRNKLQQLEVPSLIAIHGAASITVVALLLIQIGLWLNIFGGSPFYTALAPVVDWSYVAIGLYLLSFALSLIASKYLAVSLVIPFAGFAAAVFNKWNIMVKAQAGMRSGLTFLEPGIEHFAHEIPVMVAIIAAGVFLAIVLTSIFPLEVKDYD